MSNVIKDTSKITKSFNDYFYYFTNDAGNKFYLGTHPKYGLIFDLVPRRISKESIKTSNDTTPIKEYEHLCAQVVHWSVAQAIREIDDYREALKNEGIFKFGDNAYIFSKLSPDHTISDLLCLLEEERETPSNPTIRASSIPSVLTQEYSVDWWRTSDYNPVAIKSGTKNTVLGSFFHSLVEHNGEVDLSKYKISPQDMTENGTKKEYKNFIAECEGSGLEPIKFSDYLTLRRCYYFMMLSWGDFFKTEHSKEERLVISNFRKSGFDLAGTIDLSHPMYNGYPTITDVKTTEQISVINSWIENNAPAKVKHAQFMAYAILKSHSLGINPWEMRLQALAIHLTDPTKSLMVEMPKNRLESLYQETVDTFDQMVGENGIIINRLLPALTKNTIDLTTKQTGNYSFKTSDPTPQIIAYESVEQALNEMGIKLEAGDTHTYHNKGVDYVIYKVSVYKKILKAKGLSVDFLDFCEGDNYSKENINGVWSFKHTPAQKKGSHISTVGILKQGDTVVNIKEFGAESILELVKSFPNIKSSVFWEQWFSSMVQKTLVKTLIAYSGCFNVEEQKMLDTMIQNEKELVNAQPHNIMV